MSVKDMILGIRFRVDGAGQAFSGVRELQDGVKGLGSEANRATGLVGGLARGVATLAAVVGVSLSIKEFVQQADAMALMDARLKNAVGSGQAFAAAQREIYSIAQANNIGLQEATQLYTKLAAPVTRLGGTTREVGGIVNAFATSLRVGGASAQEAASATLQFAQAMGSGTLSGDEFRAMAEASPRFMQALAEGMGKPIEALKKMGSEGKLTADVVGNALLASLGKLNVEAKAIPDTVGGAMSRIKNDVLVAVNDLNKSSGLTLGLAGTLEMVRKELVPTIRDELGGAFTAVGQFINENRDELEDVWSMAKALAGEVFGIVKALATAAAATVAWAVQSGTLRTTFEALRLVVAGLEDGITILGAGFAFIGGQLLRLASLVNPSLSAAADSALAYADTVFERFGKGDTAVARLGASIEKSKADAQALRAALSENSLSAAENARELGVLGRQAVTGGDAFKTLKSSIAATSAEAKKAAEDYKKLIEKIGGKIIELKAEAGATAELTAIEKLQVQTYGELSRGLLVLSASQKVVAGNLFAEALAAEAANAATKASIELKAELLKIEAKAIEDALDRSDKIDAETKAQLEANAALGLTKNAVQQLELARVEETLATATQRLQTALADGTNKEALETITLTVEALRRLRDAKKDGIAKEALIDEAQATARAWKEVTDSIGQGLTDSLFRAFESGRGFFDTLWKGIKNTIKTTVLKVALQPVQQGVSSFMGSVASSIAGGITGGGGASAGSSVLGNIGSLAGIAGTLGAAGTALGSGIGAGIAGTLAGAGGATLGAGASLVSGAVGAGSAVGAAGGAGLMVGAAIPYVAAALALYAAYKAIAGKATHHMGSVVNATAEGTRTLFGDSSQIANNLDAKTDDALKGMGSLTVGVLNTLSKAFGGAGGYDATLKFAADGKDQSIGSLGINQGGSTVNQFGITNDYNKYTKDREEAMKAYTADVASATRDAIDKMKLPDWARKQFAALGSAATIEQLASLVDSITTVNAALAGVQRGFAGLGGIFGRVSSLGAEALMQLGDFAGGLENLGAMAGSFAQNYYNREEIAGIKAREIQQSLEALGITKDFNGEDARGQFRRLVEGTDVSTEAGRKQLASLLAISESFTSVADYLAETGSSLKATAQQAPELGALAPLLQSGTSQQVEATNGVRDAIVALHETIVKQGQTAAPLPVAEERWMIPREVGMAGP